MEREANYTAVGAFVLLVTAMAVLFVYWYSEGRDRGSYERYEIYFPGSVTGLSVGSSVRYLGVEVGKVRRLRLDPRSAERVQVIVEIDEATPVSEQTTARLSTLSIATGLLYIDLRQNTQAREVQPPVPGERYPVINTVRSGFDAFLDQLPELAGNVTVLLARAQDILSPENSAKLSETVQHLHEASQALPGTMRRAEALVEELGETSRAVRRLAADAQRLTGEIGPDVRQLATRLSSTAEHLERTSDGIERFVAENRDSVSGFAQEGLPQLRRVLEEAHDAAAEFRELSRSLKSDPSQLIYQRPVGGVEVPR